MLLICLGVSAVILIVYFETSQATHPEEPFACFTRLTKLESRFESIKFPQQTSQIDKSYLVSYREKERFIDHRHSTCGKTNTIALHMRKEQHQLWTKKKLLKDRLFC